MTLLPMSLVALQGLVRLGAGDFHRPDLEFVAVLAGLLDDAVAQADFGEPLADIGNGDRSLEHDPDERALAEIDAQLEAAAEDDVEQSGEDDGGR